MMTDANNDDIYEVTVQLLTNTDYEFKYRFWNGGNVSWEGSANRMLNINVNADTTLDLVCFGQMSACSGDLPFGPSNVTFAVDLGAETPADSIWVMGSFTDPQWQGGSFPLEYSGEGAVFTATVEVCPNTFLFKFVNGDVNTVDNEEFYGDTANLPCNISNGLGGYNREVVRTSPNDTVIAFFFNSCDTFAFFPVGVESIVDASPVAVYPNPFTNDLFISSDAPVAIDNVRILDLSGRTIAVVAGQNRNVVRVDVSALGLQKGIYLIEVNSVNGDRQVVKASSM
jgi:hypothetical protein